MYLEFLSKNQINPGGSTLKSDIKLSTSVHPTERKRLKVFNLQNDLQLSIAKAKSDYESNLALNYAHTNNNKIFNIFVTLKGMKTSQPRCTIMTYLQPLIWTRHNYLMTTFFQYFLLLQIHH